MVKLLALVVVCFLWIFCEAGGDHDHEFEKRLGKGNVEEVIDKLQGLMGVQNHIFKPENMENLLTTLESNKICQQTSNQTYCSDCLKGQVLLGDNPTIGEEEFLQTLPSLTLFIISQDIGAVCKNFSRANDEIFALFTNKYGGPTLNKEKVVKILEDVNKTVSKYATDKNCFDVNDVIRGAGVSSKSIDKEDFELVTIIIIYNVYKKKCIALPSEEEDDHHHELPEADHFIDEIFEKFGENDRITRKGFKQLLSKLGEKTKFKLGQVDDDEEHSNGCYTSDNLFEIFGHDEKEGNVTRDNFKEICPALIEQLQSGKCGGHDHDDHDDENDDDENTDTWEPWIASLVAIVISGMIPAVSGAFTKPLLKKSWFPVLLLFMVSMGVAVLLGDAILHLIPHSLGLHNHDHHEHDEHSADEIWATDSFLWKSTLTIAGIYLFFVFELLMHARGHGHSHGDHDEMQLADTYPHQHVVTANTDVVKPGPQVIANNHLGNGHLVMDEKPVVNEKRLPVKYFRTVVWAVLLGDALHNLVDGIAIGAVFSEKFPAGLNGGISTTIAILLHELPHELGDFAILIQSGLSFPQALCLNLISSLTAVIGGVIGLLLGTQWNAGPWVFAVAAGIFIYIAIADMLPEVLHSKVLKYRTCLGVFVAMTGMFLGFAIMFLIAAFEEQIAV